MFQIIAGQTIETVAKIKHQINEQYGDDLQNYQNIIRKIDKDHQPIYFIKYHPHKIYKVELSDRSIHVQKLANSLFQSQFYLSTQLPFYSQYTDHSNNICSQTSKTDRNNVRPITRTNIYRTVQAIKHKLDPKYSATSRQLRLDDRDNQVSSIKMKMKLGFTVIPFRQADSGVYIDNNTIIMMDAKNKDQIGQQMVLKDSLKYKYRNQTDHYQNDIKQLLMDIDDHQKNTNKSITVSYDPDNNRINCSWTHGYLGYAILAKQGNEQQYGLVKKGSIDCMRNRRYGSIDRNFVWGLVDHQFQQGDIVVVGWDWIVQKLGIQDLEQNVNKYSNVGGVDVQSVAQKLQSNVWDIVDSNIDDEYFPYYAPIVVSLIQ